MKEETADPQALAARPLQEPAVPLIMPRP